MLGELTWYKNDFSEQFNLIKLKMPILDGPRIPLMSIYLRYKKLQEQCLRMVTATLFVMAKNPRNDPNIHQ